MSNFTARFVDCSEIAPAIGFFLHHKYAVQKYCIATPLLGIVNLQHNSKWGSQSTSAEWASLELFFLSSYSFHKAIANVGRLS